MQLLIVQSQWDTLLWHEKDGRAWKSVGTLFTGTPRAIAAVPWTVACRWEPETVSRRLREARTLPLQELCGHGSNTVVWSRVFCFLIPAVRWFSHLLIRVYLKVRSVLTVNGKPGSLISSLCDERLQLIPYNSTSKKVPVLRKYLCTRNVRVSAHTHIS